MNTQNTHTEMFTVVCAYSQPGTNLRSFEIAPLDPERAMSRRNIIEDIAYGQIEHVHQVWHASSDQPLRDVTEEIAESVAAFIRDSSMGEVGSEVGDFLEQHLGVFATERYARARVV